MNLSGKKILITGGLGFIGTSLAKKLRELGFQVTIFDLAQGQDIEDQNQLKSFIKRKFDIIYHLAGFSGSGQSNQEREKCFRVNTLAAASLFEFIVKFSPKTKLILSSSRLEYGNPQYLPVDEAHPTVPTSAYGLSKLAATSLALVYHQKNNLDVTVFRTSNVYGPHPKTAFSGYNVINHFIDLAKADGDLAIYGDGEQKRDYLFIDDLTDAFLLAATKRPTGQIYNLGAGVPIMFKDMAKLIVQKVGLGRIKYVNWPENSRLVETGSYVSDLTKIRKDLGFEPKVGFAEGVERTIKGVR